MRDRAANLGRMVVAGIPLPVSDAFDASLIGGRRQAIVVARPPACVLA